MGKEVTKAEAYNSGLIITVAGKAARGKTTVARLIEETLRREGFSDVTVYDDLGDTPGKPPIEVRVEKTKEQVIIIETEQLPR